MRQPKTWLYVGHDAFEALCHNVEAKEVDSGENVVVLVPDDLGVLRTFEEDKYLDEELMGLRYHHPLMSIRFLLLGLALFAPSALAQLDDQTARKLVERYRASRAWGLRAVVLGALGRDWPPAAAPIVAEALGGKERRLHAFALEALRRCDERRLRAAASREIIELLVTRGLGKRNALFRGRALELLQKLAPFVDAQDEAGVRRWWSQVGATYRPPGEKPAEPAKEAPERTGSVEAYRKQQVQYVTRAAMIGEVGLDVVLCIDSTGSMQPAIDATRAAVGQIVALLQGISPTFRLGLVHYKDEATFKGGAQQLVPLTGQVGRVGALLARLRAEGGGERPESIERGLFLALDRSMGWRRMSVKAVIVIGDAPCYEKKLAELLNMAGQAHRGPWEGWADTTRPFVVSSLAVGTAPDTRRVFEELARRGGGAFGQVAGAAKSDDAIVKHLIAVSFGQQWAAQLDGFLATYRLYRGAKYFK